MTYSSRSSRIWRGVGLPEPLSKFRSASCLRKVAEQRSTHSLQMKTPGPAMRLRTSDCELPHNEPWSSSFFGPRSEEHTSELQSLMRVSYDVSCSKKQKITR